MLRDGLRFLLIGSALVVTACSTGEGLKTSQDHAARLASADHFVLPARHDESRWNRPVVVGQDQIVEP